MKSKICILGMFIALFAGLTGCGDDNKQPEITGTEIQVNDGAFSPEELMVQLKTVGATATLTAKALPESDGVIYSWVSNQPKVVEITPPYINKSITITARAEGNAIIMLKAGDHTTHFVNVYVGVVPPTAIQVKVDAGPFENAPFVTLKMGATETALLTAKALPEAAEGTEFSWSSNNKMVADVSAEKGESVTLNAITAGNAVITVSGGGKSAKIDVAVLPDNTSKPLYLTGTANPGTAPVPLMELTAGRKYRWFGALQAGTFKFVYDVDTELPSLNKGSDENTLVLRETAGAPDNLFTITQAGKYILELDVDNKILTRTYLAIQNYPETIYVRGIANLGGSAAWLPFNFDEFIPGYNFRLWIPETGGGAYIYGPNYASWGGPLFVGTTGNSIINDLDVTYGYNDANRWIITADQGGCYYNITLNVATAKIKFEKQ
jgi:hypothetical protein